MSIADRIAKLRRMAEHPTSNPHEAAIAREEMERLQREHPTEAQRAATPEPPREWDAWDAWRGRDPMDDIRQWWARERAKHASRRPPPPAEPAPVEVPENARRGECYVCKVKLGAGWIDAISATLCPAHHSERESARSQRWAWNRSGW